MKGLLKNPLIKFILVATGLYLFWYILYEFYLKISTSFDNIVIDNLVFFTKKILLAFGYNLVSYSEIAYQNVVQIEDSLGVTVGAPCDGIVLLALFTVFILAFPGPWKHKIWFLPLGLISIHFINVLRIVSLAIIVDINPAWLDFNHDYTFTILVYAFVFFLWYIWVNKFSPLKNTSNAKA